MYIVNRTRYFRNGRGSHSRATPTCPHSQVGHRCAPSLGSPAAAAAPLRVKRAQDLCPRHARDYVSTTPRAAPLRLRVPRCCPCAHLHAAHLCRSWLTNASHRFRSCVLPGGAASMAAVPRPSTAALPPGMRVVGDYEIPPEEEQRLGAKRGYTTRAKEEARRTEVKFTGLVRRWEKRWVLLGHLRVLRWERVQDGVDGGEVSSRVQSSSTEEPARKRARQ